MDERGGLESRCGLRVTVGSNPTPSALAMRAFVASVVMVLLLAGCSDSSRPRSAASSAASSGPPPATVLTPEEQRLNAMLLTPQELGVTFTSAQLGAPQDTPEPCGQPDPRSVVRPQTRVVALLADYLDGLGVAENLSSFETVDEAQRVMGLLRDGVSCGQGTINAASAAESGPASVALSDVQDVSAQVGVADAFAVVVTLPDGSLVTTVAARVDRLVVVFQIGAKGNKGALDPLHISQQGIAKLGTG